MSDEQCFTCEEVLDECTCDMCSDCNSEPCDCRDSYEACEGCGHDVMDCNCN